MTGWPVLSLTAGMASTLSISAQTNRAEDNCKKAPEWRGIETGSKDFRGGQYEEPLRNEVFTTIWHQRNDVRRRRVCGEPCGKDCSDRGAADDIEIPTEWSFCLQVLPPGLQDRGDTGQEVAKEATAL